jgi:hypothetical protein
MKRILQVCTVVFAKRLDLTAEMHLDGHSKVQTGQVANSTFLIID